MEPRTVTPGDDGVVPPVVVEIPGDPERARFGSEDRGVHRIRDDVPRVNHLIRQFLVAGRKDIRDLLVDGLGDYGGD